MMKICANENQADIDDANAMVNILTCLQLVEKEASLDRENGDNTDEHPDILIGANLIDNETNTVDGSALNKNKPSREEEINGSDDDCRTGSEDVIPVLTKRLNRQRQRAVAAT
ncbi:hypothetical protein IEQ34_006586 [Dendrobium chrysotoxum]|uniref:Uncharacterized protein n=1 Tax=Dendrobium chrysotoxum TaxID=161865 RepID=A0AAV7GPJ2_DENCH|nr:hypothetical protein IEQ34_006586 [Dendrobium chrysotoxum]